MNLNVRYPQVKCSAHKDLQDQSGFYILASYPAEKREMKCHLFFMVGFFFLSYVCKSGGRGTLGCMSTLNTASKPIGSILEAKYIICHAQILLMWSFLNVIGLLMVESRPSSQMLSCFVG